MKWEYKVTEYTKDQAGIDALNVDGAASWEAIFVIAETPSIYRLLLKRRYL